MLSIDALRIDIDGDTRASALGRQLASPRHFDPYLFWQIATSGIDRTASQDGPDIPLLIELARPVAVLGGELVIGNSSYPLWPSFLRARAPDLGALRVHPVVTTWGGLIAALNGAKVSVFGSEPVAIDRFELGLARRRGGGKERDMGFTYAAWLNRPLLEAGSAQVQRRLTEGLGPRLCVIDDRCNFAARGIAESLSAIWHQGGSAETVETLDRNLWSSPLQLRVVDPGVGKPVQFDFAGSWIGRLRRIDSARTVSAAETGNEADVYRREGYMPRAVPRWSHGSAVLDLVAGERAWVGTAATGPHWVDRVERPRNLHFVQLPIPTVQDTSGGSLAGCALDAIHSAIDAADPGQHVIVNLSYGTHSSGHDATSIWDTGLRELLDLHDGAKAGSQRKTLHVVVPAGNSHLLRCHASAHFSRPGDRVVWRWQVMPDNDEDSYLELWLPEDRDLRWRVRVTAPDGSCEDLDSAGLRWWPAVDDAKRIGAALIWPALPAQSRRGGMVLLACGPTLRSADTRASVRALFSDAGVPAPQAQHGIYTIELTLLAGQPTSSVHLWAQRSDNAPGRIRQLRGHAGRQSRLLEVRDEPQGAPVDPRFTLNGIATVKHDRLYVIGAMRKMDSGLCSYSGAGPNRLDDKRSTGADWVLPADESLNQPGVLMRGLLSGARLRVPGTSIAAAAFTRVLYEHLSANPAASALAGTCPARPTREVDPAPRGSPMRADPWLRGETVRTALAEPDLPTGGQRPRQP